MHSRARRVKRDKLRGKTAAVPAAAEGISEDDDDDSFVDEEGGSDEESHGTSPLSAALHRHEFFKIICGHGFEASYFRRAYAAYTSLAAAFEDASDPPPPSIVPATLLFGAGELCVRMPWISGRDSLSIEIGDR